jgi:myo-inositol 2-dehydrogenase / D-chiro-inositol 1-dehydrogenase
MVRFAVLGCGRIGRMHARNIKAHPRAELVACFDVASEAAEETASETGAVAVSSVEEALDDFRIDAVFIASSTDTHVDLITRSAKAKKGMLCEKPIDLDIARVDACWQEIGGMNPVTMIGFNRRFDPYFKSVRDRLTTGEIGRLEQVIITSRDPAPPPPAYVKTSGSLFAI